MLTSLPVTVCVAAILGFLAGLGVGGGSLLILWLTLVLDVSQADARILNLLFFLPAAAISCFFRGKQRDFSLKSAFPAIISGCAAAIAFSLIGMHFDNTVLKKLFGVLLLFTGFRELFCKPKQN